MTWWRCGDSNPGPRRPLPGFYERSLRFDLALMAPVDGIRERRSVLDVPLSGGGRAFGGQSAWVTLRPSPADRERLNARPI